MRPHSPVARVRDQPAQMQVSEPDLAVVAVDARRPERRYLRMRLVGQVRVVVVDPQKELPVAVRGDEGDRVVGDLARRRPVRFHRPVDRDVQRGALGVVLVHAALETAMVAQREVVEAEHAAREVARGVQGLGGGANVRPQARPPD